MEQTSNDLTNSYRLAQIAAEAANKVKAEDIVAIDVHDRLALTDVFVLASATSQRQVDAVVSSVDQAMHAEGVAAKVKEGKESGHWVLLDYGVIVVHIFYAEDREFYNLERLWKDCPQVPLKLENPERSEK